MSRIDYVRSVLGEVGERLQIDPVEMDSNDRATLTFNDLPLTFAYSLDPVEVLWLYVDFGEIPAEGDAAPEYLLKLGLRCWAANLLTIGLSEDGRKATGFTAIPVTRLDAPQLLRLLEAVLKMALPVHERLVQRNFSVAAAGSGSNMPNDGSVIVG